MRSLFASAAIVLATAITAFADTPPWQKPAPAMNAQHQQAAAQIAKIVQSSNAPLARLGFNPLTTEWDWQRGQRSTQPMSNMTQAGLSGILSGRYYVYYDPFAKADGGLSVNYMAPDGTAYRCMNWKNGYREDRAKWSAKQSAMGFAGIQKLAGGKDGYGWPTVYNSGTGNLILYGYDGRNWHPTPGHVQNEYAPAFAELCPNLPRVANVNQAQTSTDYATFRRQAPGAAIRGAGVVFPSNPSNPLTAEMYYALYPPQLQ